MTLDEIRAKLANNKNHATVDDVEKLSEDERTEPITYEQFKVWEELKNPVPKSRMVQYDEYSDVIKCPHCGDTYLHHLGVETFHVEEDTNGYRVGIYDETSHGWPMLGITCPDNVVDDKTKTNPGYRRGGVLILFGCEGCHNVSRLGIGQNKGQSMFKWSFKL